MMWIRVLYIDYRNIKSLTLEELRDKFGVVFQSDVIFSGTILENIDFGRNIDLNNIEDSCGYSSALEFVKDKGYSYIVASGGSNLSGGQRQRILLSRAMAKKPEILILDDSSSALDYKTDLEVRKSIMHNFLDTTLIVVSSRISAVKDLSKIIVLEDGVISAVGSHDELLKTSELYTMIKISQMGGEE